MKKARFDDYVLVHLLLVLVLVAIRDRAAAPSASPHVFVVLWGDALKNN